MSRLSLSEEEAIMIIEQGVAWSAHRVSTEVRKHVRVMEVLVPRGRSYALNPRPVCCKACM